MAGIVGSMYPTRDGGQNGRQLPQNVIFWPVGRFVTQAEIDVVDLNLAEPPHRAGTCGPVVATAKLGVRPSERGTALPHGLQGPLCLDEVAGYGNR
jgi:hypothetical protein